MPLKIILAIIKALTKFVQVLDKCRFGAVMLIVVMAAAGALMTIPHLQPALA